jgi:hypothetical protein
MVSFTFDDHNPGDATRSHRSQCTCAKQVSASPGYIRVAFTQAGGDIIAKGAEICGQWTSPRRQRVYRGAMRSVFVGLTTTLTLRSIRMGDVGAAGKCHQETVYAKCEINSPSRVHDIRYIAFGEYCDHGVVGELKQALSSPDMGVVRQNGRTLTVEPVVILLAALPREGAESLGRNASRETFCSTEPTLP